jgi:hypothetical protein
MEIYRPTNGDSFAMTVFGINANERKTAGAYLLGKAGTLPQNEYKIVGALGGLNVVGQLKHSYIDNNGKPEYGIAIGSVVHWTGDLKDSSPVGIVQRLEHIGGSLAKFLAETQTNVANNERRLAEATSRVGRTFEHQSELDTKVAELKEIESQLIAESKRVEEELRAAEAAAKEAAAAAGAHEAA